MPPSVAAKRISARSIASRQIATKLSSGGAPAYVAVLSPDTTSWTCPADGTYQVNIWGGGGGGNFNGGGDGGAFCRATRKMKKGDVIPLTIPKTNIGSTGGDATATLPDGTVMTAQGGSLGAAHLKSVASGGDINVNGSFAVFTGSGANSDGGQAGGVPGMLGGTGGNSTNATGGAPGGGGGYIGAGRDAGSGLAVIVRVA